MGVAIDGMCDGLMTARLMVTWVRNSRARLPLTEKSLDCFCPILWQSISLRGRR